MSRSASVKVIFPDEPRTLRLGIGQLEILQEKTGKGPEALLQRLTNGEWFVEELVEVIRQALLGAGTPAALTDKLIKTYVICEKGQERGLAHSLPFAQVALAAVLFGADDEDLDLPAGDADPPGKSQTPTESSSSASSLEKELLSSGGRRTSVAN